MGDSQDRPFRDVPDEALACHAATNEPAMAELYLRYRDPIQHYCRHRISDHEDVQDLVSNIFIRVMVGLARSKVERFRPWLFTIAHNEVANAYRARRLEASLDPADPHADPDPSPENLAVASDNLRYLRKVMSRLNEQYRSVIELDQAGLTNPEIGQVLGKSSAWVATTRFRAYKRLKQLVEESGR